VAGKEHDMKNLNTIQKKIVSILPKGAAAAVSAREIGAMLRKAGLSMLGAQSLGPSLRKVRDNNPDQIFCTEPEAEEYEVSPGKWKISRPVRKWYLK